MRSGRRQTGIGAAAATVFVALALAGCGGGKTAGTKGGQITWLVDQPWGGVYNEYRAEGSSYYLREVLAGTVPAAGDFSPAGAWTWSTDLFSKTPTLVSDSPQTMLFPISPNAVWSDGRPIDVDDFRFAWFHNSARDDQCKGCDAADSTGWELVDSINATDNGKTVTIKLRPGAVDAEWFAHFEPSRYPAHVAAAQGFDWHSPEGMGKASQYFAGNVPKWSGGPYLIDSVVPDERAILVPNTRWYGKVKPKLDRVVLEVVSQPGDVLPALQNGELDGGAPLAFNPDVVEQLQKKSDIRTTVGSGGGTFDHMEVNAKSPALADIALRRAILTAIDTKQLRRRMFGRIEPTLRTNVFFEASSPRHKDVVAPTGFGSGNIDAARALLTNAGYSGAKPGGSLAKNGVAVPALRFPHGASKDTLAEVVQFELAQIGVSVAPTTVVASEFLSTLKGGGFDLAAFSLGGGPLVVGAPGQLFRSHSPINFSGLNDPEIDKLIDQIGTTVHIDAVDDLANQIAALALTHATVLPLWDNPSYAFVRKGYVNVQDNRYSSVRALYDFASWAATH